MKELLTHLFMLIPLAWELVNDRDGEDEFQKRQDVTVRGLWALFAGILAVFAHWPILRNGDAFVELRHDGLILLSAAILSAAYHFLLFDYLIAFILKKRGVIHYSGQFGWFSYLGEKSVIDNLPLWRQLPAWFRAMIRITVFEAALLFYLYSIQ